eukprot:s5808_g3.t2
MKACCESDSLVWESCGPGPELLLEARRALAEFAMSPSTRAGRQGPLSQAFLQRYESSAQSDEDLEDRGEGILVQLPRRALYLFFGFARFHLRHGGRQASETCAISGSPESWPAAQCQRQRMH